MAKKQKGRFFTREDTAGVWLMYETHTGIELALAVYAKGTPTAAILQAATNGAQDNDDKHQRQARL